MPNLLRTTRRRFSKTTLLATASAAATVGSPRASSAVSSTAANARIRVGVIGCGSVSGSYLPSLAKCPEAEVVSACDIRLERARSRAGKFKIPNIYPNFDEMLAGVDFDLLVNLTDIQEHERLNRQAIEAGKHVWSEKPIANSLAVGQALLQLARERGQKLWCAPNTVESPQFAHMANLIAEGQLGQIAAAHGEYGHTGPTWSPFFYEKGGGSLPDLAVYNLTTLTGLLGPARSVTAMTSIVTPKRGIRGVGEIDVVAEDNAMILLDHGEGVISHVQSGFNYFQPTGPYSYGKDRHTVSIVGNRGLLGLVGYDWEPFGIDVATEKAKKPKRVMTEPGDYAWQNGAALAVESLAKGRKLMVNPEQALHVAEVIEAARRSQESGQRIALASTFPWPLVPA